MKRTNLPKPTRRMAVFGAVVLVGLWLLAAIAAWMDGYSIAGAALGAAVTLTGSCVLAAALIAGTFWAMRDERPHQLHKCRCDCGHDGLDAMFHLRPCPVAELRAAARKLGYDLALIPREDAP